MMIVVMLLLQRCHYEAGPHPKKGMDQQIDHMSHAFTRHTWGGGEEGNNGIRGKI